jgi:SAM-dependent methyltransferase
MVKYDPESRKKRAGQYAATLADLTNLRDKRVLEIGPQLGDLSIRLASDFGCEVVGIDPMPHPDWPAIQAANPRIRFIEGDIADPPADLEDASFDLVVSFVVWEHIRHPWSALRHCQRLLKPDGKKFLRANLYRSAIASHLYGHIKEPWPHLLHSPEDLARMLKRKTLGWAFWVNKLTYQQYLFYFRELGFFITHEKLFQAHFDPAVYAANEQKLGLYPQWDLGTDFFEVLLEFDPATPKQRIPDPVYRLGPPKQS